MAAAAESGAFHFPSTAEGSPVRQATDVKNTKFSKKRATGQLKDLQAKLKRVKKSGAKKSVLADVRHEVARKKATVRRETDQLTVAKATQAAACG